MTIKVDAKRIRDRIATTRQAMANAGNRSVPKFKHPARPKRAVAETVPVSVQPTEAPAEETVATSETQEGGEHRPKPPQT